MTTAEFPTETSVSGQFVRQANRFTARFSADGSTGFPAVRGRYHLYVCYACPWAHRSIIVRRLLGLEDVISMSAVDPIRDERGWRFTRGPGHGPDPVNGFDFLSEAYLASDPAFEGRHTVPAVWDRESRRIVTNDFHQITLDLSTEFGHLGHGGVDLYPEHLRPAIDEVSRVVYQDVNNGVYRAGFATSQEAYEAAFDALFARLDWLEQRLAGQRYVLGARLTEVDVRLYTTLVRFDTVYAQHFKCNLRRIVDYPHLWAYTRDLYQTPGFGDTTDFDHIKRHYYGTHGWLNPNEIVPKGPALDWTAPHGRERLG